MLRSLIPVSRRDDYAETLGSTFKSRPLVKESICQSVAESGAPLASLPELNTEERGMCGHHLQVCGIKGCQAWCGLELLQCSCPRALGWPHLWFWWQQEK